MKLSIVSPVKNEADWIGYSIMACLEHVHEFVYACAKSSDGTDELLDHIKTRYGGDKIKILRKPEYDFNVHDMAAYNRPYNDAIEASKGKEVIFLHPDMIVTNPEKIKDIIEGPLAYWTNLTSYAGDMQTVITKGRASKWKNIHAKRFGLKYYGAYGSECEDFYHTEITGKQYLHHGQNFRAYPFRVEDSGLKINHYCENKSYARRLEKMKSCLKNLHPTIADDAITAMAIQHPRVTLEPMGSDIFGHFEFNKTDVPVPEVFYKYKAEFDKVLGRS